MNKETIKITFDSDSVEETFQKAGVWLAYLLTKDNNNEKENEDGNCSKNKGNRGQSQNL